MKKGWLWGLSLGLLFLLGGCGTQPEEPPVVLSKMMKAISKTEKLEFSGNFQIVGNSTLSLLQGLQDLQVSGIGKINLRDVKNFKYLLDVIISGTSSEGKTEVGAELRSFPDYSYFRVTQLKVPLGLPFSLSADKRWYKIRSNGENQDWLGSTQPLTNDQIQQLRGLIAQSQLFNIVQKFPDETVNGTRAYHWQVAIDATELLKLFSSWSTTARSIDNVDWKHLAAMLVDYQYELWINKYNYQLVEMSIKGWYDNPDRQRTDFITQLIFKKFNTTINIERPTNVEEFNLRQLLGLPSAVTL